MKVEKSDFGNYKVKFDTTTGIDYFYLFTHPTNCKIASIERTATNLRLHPKPFIEAIKKALLHRSKTAFKITVKNKHDVELLKKHFPIMFCTQVPLGYGTDYQYHATFLKDDKSRYYKRRTEKTVLLDNGSDSDDSTSTTTKD